VDDYPRGTLIRLDPANGQTTEHELPGGKQSLPYAMASDGRGRVWVAETGLRPNQLTAFDTRLGRVVSITPVSQSGGITIRHMTFDRAPTASGSRRMRDGGEGGGGGGWDELRP